MKEEKLFHQVLELAADQRAAYLDAVCGADVELRERVESLLRAQANPGSFLQSPAFGVGHSPTIDQSPVERPGTQLGPYKLLQQIGEGGMGTVFMAEQHEPVKRRVALKVIKLGMDTRQVIARFEAERQALTLMDHPNIAKVLDAGTTDSGRPYFVMELVQGQPITEYCDEHRLTPRQRLELLIPVCQAIQHAHQKGIIHRDIKPTNILVAEYDEHPVPKVIDFGVAKATSQTLTEKTMFTGLGQIVGTLEYMSPEQAKVNQLDIDTRSDIYSLGVLLYELLTGSTPFNRKRLQSAAFDEMLRIIREEEPPKPSTRLSDSHDSLPSISAQRQTEPAKLTKLIRGELDWIVMKALEKDRSRRYETANGFAQDVQRYLADEPVLACPPSAAYRLRKFARRNRLKLVAGAVLTLALLVAIGVVGWAVRDRAAQQADVERAQTERLARTSSTVQPILAETDRLMAVQKWPEALAMVRRAGATVSVGEADEATVQKARGLLKDLEFIDRLEETHMQHGAMVEGQFDYADTDRKYAGVYRDYGVDVDELAVETSIERLKVRPALAIPLAAALDQWRDVRSKISEQHAAGCGRLVAVARGVDPEPLRDQIRSIEGQPASKGEELHRLARSINIRAHHPATLVSLAAILVRTKDSEFALRLQKDAVSVYPGDFWLNFELARALSLQKDYEGAVRYYTAAVAIRPASAAAHNNLGLALGDLNRLDEAVTCLWKAIELDPQLVHAYQNLAETLRQQRKLDQALVVIRKAIELDPNHARARYCLGHILHEKKQHDEAIVAYRKTIELDPKDANAHNGLGAILCDITQDYDAALASFLQAIALKPDHVQAWANRGNAHARLKQHDEAIAAYRKAIDLVPKYASAYNGIGLSLQTQGKIDEALGAFRKAIEVSPNHFSAHVNLVRGLKARGKTVDAIAASEEMIRLLPKSAPAANDFAWLLATGPDPKLRDAPRAVELAKKAVELAPMIPAFGRTLGVAQYRAGNWEEAVAALEKSMELGKGGNSYDWFFLAMAHWQLGDKGAAHTWYTRAAAGTDKFQPRNDELRRFQAEAAELIGDPHGR